MHNQHIGNYDIERQIGEGGMGSVYLGVHRVTYGRAAIKVLQPHIARNPEMAERFLREARAATRAEHPGIVKILDYGLTPDGLPYLAMEHIEGQPLSKYLTEQKRLSLTETLRIGQQIATALASAHGKQVVHRDLKPENIMRLSDQDTPHSISIKIVDFGIARIDAPSDLEKLTRTGSFLGTPCYMAPEVVMDPRRASDRSDVYALGIIIYQMLVGEPPFTGNSLGEVVLKHLGQKPPSLAQRAPAAPSALCKLVRSMLAKRPEDRPPMKTVSLALHGIETWMIGAGARRESVRARRLMPSPFKRLLAWSLPSLLVGAVALGLAHPGLIRKGTPPSASPAVTPSHPVESAPRTAAQPTRPPAPELAPAALPNPGRPRPADPIRTGEHHPHIPAKGVSKEPAEKLPAVPPSPVRLATAERGGVERSLPGLWTLRDPFDTFRAQPEGGTALGTASSLRSAAEQYLMDAGQARSQGNLPKAVEKTRMAILGLPESAWSFIGTLGCEARDYGSVQEATRHLGTAQRACLEDTCRYFGIVRRNQEWRVDPTLRLDKGNRSREAHLALQDAEQAYREHLYERAIESARLAVGEHYYDAWQVIGLAACMRTDSQLARDALCRLEPLRQRNVRYACRRNRIELPSQ